MSSTTSPDPALESMPPAETSTKKKTRKSRSKNTSGRAGAGGDADGDEIEAAPVAKRGNPGNFHRARLEFLLTKLPAYREYAAKKTKRRRGSGKSFWDTLLPEYFEKFPWRLDLKTEPPADAEELAKLAAPAEGEEEEKLFVSTTDDIENKVIWWFARQVQAETKKQNPFAPMMKGLRKPDGSRPRRRADIPFYMSHPDFKDKVDAEFERRGFNERDRDEHLALRIKVAKSLWLKEPAEVWERIKSEARDEHEEEMIAYRDAVEGLPSADPAAQKEARAKATPVVNMFLDALQAYTGYTLVLFAGRMDEAKNVRLTSWTAGATAESSPELDFSRANKAEYDGAIERFSRFVGRAYLASNAPSAPVDADSASRTPGSASPSVGVVPLAVTPSDTEAVVPSASTSPDNEGVVRSASTPPDAESGPICGEGEAINTGASTLDKEVTHMDNNEPDPPRDPYASWNARPGEFLRAALEAMPSSERRQRTRALWVMSQYELDREQNIMRNRATLASLGLGPGGVTWGGADKAATGTKRKGASGGTSNAKRKRQMEGDEWSREDDDDNENDEEEGDVEGSGSVDPRATRAATKRGATGKGQEGDDVAQWAEDAKAQLLGGGAALGNSWSELVEAWFSREEAADFKKLPAALPTKGRPAQISAWVGRARAAKYDPGIKDAVAFGTQVEAWWRSINPLWRRLGKNGEIIGDGVVMTRTEGEDWGKMAKTGPNALLNVLKCLQWWAEAAKHAPGERWEAVVEDVGWALEAMERSEAAMAREEQEEIDADPDAGEDA
ncbi:hypothetical protein GGX14DRAFT_389933 [Mycena pura]|uniref:Uncharacterized protein n=1 Tax=Mycena pura TaxID=153505 RepID=A0AAD6YGV0_9AGAR|nr:hypothetical protein GGX14DRAFT_389933 [Mycena pura]